MRDRKDSAGAGRGWVEPPLPSEVSTPEDAAWQDLGDGRWLPYRIRGSWRGVLG